MKFAITGGAGFIGNALVRLLLSNGHQVTILDTRPSASYQDITLHCDVRNRAAVFEYTKEHNCIIHLAAEHADNVSPVSLYYDVNREGTRNIAEAATANGIKRIVFTSTVAVYGLNKGPSDEEAVLEPFNDYGRSKMEGERVLRAWAEGGEGRSTVIVRPCVVFGEGNRGNVYNLIRQMAMKKFVMIGRGLNRKSMAYVGNIAAFLEHVLTQPLSSGVRIFNYADKPDITTIELVRLVRKELGQPEEGVAMPVWLGLLAGYGFDFMATLTGRKIPISAIRIRKFISETIVSTKNLETTGFKAPYTMEIGLCNMIRKDFSDKNKG